MGKDVPDGGQPPATRINRQHRTRGLGKSSGIVPARAEANSLRTLFGGAKSSPYYLTGNSDSITQNPPCCNSALKNNLFWSSVYLKVTVLLGFNFELQHLESISQSLISSGFPPAFMLHAGSLGSLLQATLLVQQFVLQRMPCSIILSYYRSLYLF